LGGAAAALGLVGVAEAVLGARGEERRGQEMRIGGGTRRNERKGN